MFKKPTRIQMRLYPELSLFKTDAERVAALNEASLASVTLRQVAMLGILCGAMLSILGISHFRLYEPLIPAPVWLVFEGVAWVLAVSGSVKWLWRERTRGWLRQRLAELGVPICTKCGYNLRGQVEPRCPECGNAFDERLLRPANTEANGMACNRSSSEAGSEERED